MPSTRRTFLRIALPAAVGLAGCASDGGSVQTDERERSGSVSDPEVHQTRNPESGPDLEPVVTGPDGDRVDRDLIGDSERLDSLEFASGVPDRAAESARSFLEATDLSSETIYVAHRQIQSCQRLRIESVSWEPRRVEYEYCTELRPPDERCTADGREPLALFFRLPAVVDTEIRGSGASGHRPCRGSDTDYERIDPNATVEDDP